MPLFPSRFALRRAHASRPTRAQRGGWWCMLVGGYDRVGMRVCSLLLLNAMCVFIANKRRVFQSALCLNKATVTSFRAKDRRGIEYPRALVLYRRLQLAYIVLTIRTLDEPRGDCLPALPTGPVQLTTLGDRARYLAPNGSGHTRTVGLLRRRSGLELIVSTCLASTPTRMSAIARRSRSSSPSSR